MQSKVYQNYINNKETNLFIFLFLFSFLIRIPIIFIFGDTGLENEWRILVNNLTKYGKFSLINFGDFFVPNLLMPPLYAFYLYFFKVFNFSNEIYILTVLFSQALLSSFSVVIFYMINKFFFSKKISIISALIFSIFPIYIYACGQISSIILQSCLTIIFLYFFLRLIRKNNFFNIFFLSLTSGLLILLRGEFIALFVLSILCLVLFFKVKAKSILIIVLLTFVVISPYLIRNILLFDTITITKSIGFNLWKGNNPNAGVEGNADFDSNIKEQIDRIAKNKYYEINFDKFFFDEGTKNIKKDPIKYFNLYIKKFLSFIFIDINSLYTNYYHPLNYLPSLFFGITSIIGIFLPKKNFHQMNFLIFFFIANVSIFSMFFILPRYKIVILPLQIIFSSIFFEYIKNNFFRKITH